MFFRFDHVFLVPLDFSKFDINYIWMRHRRPVGWVDGVRQSENQNNKIDTLSKVDLSTYDILNFEKFEETYVRQNTEVIKRFKLTQIENIESLDLSKTGFNKNLKIQ